MARLPRNPKFWLGAFLLWFAVLWTFSSFPGQGGFAPPIDHFDKVVHFGYFFFGGGLLSAWLFRLRPDQPDWKAILPTTILAIALIGGLDEYHQTFTPGRSGNDPYDWLADALGAVAGAFAFKHFHHRLK
jgi:VanZ family protein